jgi:predicted permease
MMLSLMLLAGAGLLIRSIASFTSAPLGFVPDRLLTMTVSLPPFSYAKPEQRKTLYDEIQGRIVALPGIEAVGMSSRAAMKGSTGVSTLIVEGRPPADPKTVILDTEQQFITDGYFRCMGIGFEQGREFERQDRGDASPVAVVNTALVRKYFPNENPLGRHIRLSETGSWLTIVGVSGDERQSTPFHEMAWAAPPIVYRPLAQQPSSSVDLIVRVGSLQSIQSAVIQQEILKFAPDLRITDVHPMQYFLDKYASYPRFRAMLMGLFAGMALLLSVIGLYAVLSQLVVQRTQEIGIRMALGAQASDVLRLIMKQGIPLVGFGTGAGLMAALGLAHLLRNLLFGVQPEDPLTLTAVMALLILAALAAIYIPARRAARVNPINSLRSE